MTALIHQRVTDQAEKHIYQAQLLIQGSSATSLPAPVADTAKVSAFLLKLPSPAQAGEGKGRALLLHLLSSFRKKLCRLTKSNKAVGRSCQIRKAKQKPEVHLHQVGMRRATETPRGNLSHCNHT